MKVQRNILITLLAILGISALGGGAFLVISPSGEMIGMPLSLLNKSPFNNFLIPGIILFTVLGIAPIILIYPLLKKPESKLAQSFNLFNDMHWAWSYAVYIAFILVIWIQIEIIMINTFDPLQNFCVFLALAILFTSLLPKLRNYYKK